MPLLEEFDKTGNFLFRYRSYIPLFLYIIATAAIIISPYELLHFNNIYWAMCCLFVSLSGLIIRALTIGFTPAGTSGRNTTEGQIAEAINTKGMYSIVRHPLYLGNFLMWLGLIIYVAIPWFIILAIAFFWLYYERIIFAEEQFIRNKFGDNFVQWAEKTPAFIPNFNKWQKAELSFSFKNVLKREYSGFFAVMISFTWVNFIKYFFVKDLINIDTWWVIGGIIGFVIYIILRSLKKYSSILSVEGR